MIGLFEAEELAPVAESVEHSNPRTMASKVTFASFLLTVWIGKKFRVQLMP